MVASRKTVQGERKLGEVDGGLVVSTAHQYVPAMGAV
jgi:hypothetical protein